MYVLMIVDLTWTLMHHEKAGELNPLLAALLYSNEVMFVYLKLAANTIAALIVIYLRPRRPWLSRLLTLFGILIYGAVVWLHWVVDYSIQHAHEVHGSVIWEMISGG